MKLKSISLNHVQLPMKFNFKTAKGELKLRDTIIIIAEDENGQRGYGECVSFTTPFYTQETFESSWESLAQTYIPKVMTTHFTHPFDIHQFLSSPYRWQWQVWKMPWWIFITNPRMKIQ